jgi:hypothetical protein
LATHHPPYGGVKGTAAPCGIEIPLGGADGGGKALEIGFGSHRVWIANRH